MISLSERVKNFLTPGETLSQKVAKGGVWVFGLRITNRLFGLVRTIILARLLSPNDFGLFGIAFLAISTLECFTQTGFSAALVQKKEDIKEYLNTAWSVQIIRGLILAAILYLISPYVAVFFKETRVVPILQILALSVAIGGFRNIGVVYFQKELEFNKQFIYSFTVTLAGIGVAIPAAFILRSVWALVFGSLAGSIASVVMSYIIHPYRPHLSKDLAKAKELFGFGKWILGSSILVFLITQGDDIFVGKLLGVTMLGFYQMAYRISNLPATEITHVISQVTFPAYSKLQDNLPKLREAYLKVLQFTAFLSFPIAGLMLVLAPDFTRIFLGEKWMPMVPAMMVLVFAGLVRSMAATTGPIFQAVGKPKIITKWQPVRLFVLVALIYPFSIQWGILGTSLAVFLSNLVSSTGFSVMVVRITKCEVKNFTKRIILPLTITLIMISFMFVLKNGINMIGTLEFLLFVGVSILVYLSTTYILDRQTLLSIKEVLPIWRGK